MILRKTPASIAITAANKQHVDADAGIFHIAAIIAGLIQMILVH